MQQPKPTATKTLDGLKMSTSPAYKRTVEPPKVPHRPLKLVPFDTDPTFRPKRVSLSTKDRQYTCEVKGSIGGQPTAIAVSGTLSVLCRITLKETDDPKVLEYIRSLNLPKDAAYYAFAYPSHNLDLDVIDAHPGAIAFAALGGFVYFKDTGEDGTCALCDKGLRYLHPGDTGLSFDGPFPLHSTFADAAKYRGIHELVESRKYGMAPTSSDISTLGVVRFCWLSPSDIMESQEGESPRSAEHNIPLADHNRLWPHGAFAYFFSVDEKGSIKKDQRDCIFPVIGPKLPESDQVKREQQWQEKMKGEEPMPGTHGRIVFRGRLPRGFRAREFAHFACFSHETSSESLYQVLKHDWKLGKPKVLLSITGAAQDFKMEPRLELLIKQGLAEAARSTQAWIVTGGTDTGVMKLAGDAVAHIDGVRCIGVVSWGMTLQRERFHPERDQAHRNYLGEQTTDRGGDAGSVGASRAMGDSRHAENLVYYTPREESSIKGAALNPNHTHFLLVDKKNKGPKHAHEEYDFGGDIDTRADLERTLQEHGARAICICIQGGPGSLKQVLGALLNNCPVLLVKETGGCAQALAELVEPLLSKPLAEKPRKELLLKQIELLREGWKTKCKFNADNMLDAILDAGMRCELISVFSETTMGRTSFCSTILEAIVNGYYLQDARTMSLRERELVPLSHRAMHRQARSDSESRYPVRLRVDDAKVSWAVDFDSYDTEVTDFTHKTEVLDKLFGDLEDPSRYLAGNGMEGVDTSSSERRFVPSRPDSYDHQLDDHKPSGNGESRVRLFTHRRTFENKCRIELDKNRRPLNPFGRTGLKGRGLLSAWGPTIALDNIITRKCPHGQGYQVLSTQRLPPIGTGEWALPGEFRDIPAQYEFREEHGCRKAVCKVLRPLLKKHEGSTPAVKALERFLSEGQVIYRGYMDDPRNTDNAWMETDAWTFHVPDDLRELFDDDALAGTFLEWLDIDPDESRYVHFYAEHKKLVDIVRNVWLEKHTLCLSNEMNDGGIMQWALPNDNYNVQQAPQDDAEKEDVVLEYSPDEDEPQPGSVSHTTAAYISVGKMMTYEDLYSSHSQRVLEHTLSTTKFEHKAHAAAEMPPDATGLTRFGMLSIEKNPRGRTGRLQPQLQEGQRHRFKGPNHVAYLLMTREKPNFPETVEVLRLLRRDRRGNDLPSNDLPDSDTIAGRFERFSATSIGRWETVKKLLKLVRREDRDDSTGISLQEVGLDVELFEDVLHTVSIVYQGYMDDKFNTDDSWCEATVAHVHCVPELAGAEKVLGMPGEGFIWQYFHDLKDADDDARMSASKQKAQLQESKQMAQLQEQWEWRVRRRMSAQRADRGTGRLLSIVLEWGRRDMIETVLTHRQFTKQRSRAQVQDSFKRALQLSASGDLAPPLLELLLEHGASLALVDINWLFFGEIKGRTRRHPFIHYSVARLDTIDGFGLLRKHLWNSILMSGMISYEDEESNEDPEGNEAPVQGPGTISSLFGSVQGRSSKRMQPSAGDDVGIRKLELAATKELNDFVDAHLLAGFGAYRKLKRSQPFQLSRSERPRVAPSANSLSPKIDDTSFELLTWALACGAYELAFVIWCHSPCPLRAGLVAQEICYRLSRRFVGVEPLRFWRKRFVAANNAMLDYLVSDFELNQDVVRMLLTAEPGGADFQPCSVLGHDDATPLGLIDLAIVGRKKDFLAHRLCKQILDDAWRGRMAHSGSVCLAEAECGAVGSLSSLRLMLQLLLPLGWVKFEHNELHSPGLATASAGSAYLNESPREHMKDAAREGTVEDLSVPHRSSTRMLPPGRVECFLQMWHIPVVKFYAFFLANIAFSCFTFYVSFFADELFGPLRAVHYLWFGWMLTMVGQEVDQALTDMRGARSVLEIARAGLQRGFNGRLDTLILAMLLPISWLRLSLATCEWEECMLDPTHQVMRSLLATCWLLITLRPLEVLSVHPRIGKLIVIVYKMGQEFAVFLAPLLCMIVGFMLAFSVLVPNYRLYTDAAHPTATDFAPWLGGPYSIPLWGLFGYFEPELVEDSPYAVVGVPAMFMVLYELVAVVLMLNLLIALFNDVYVAYQIEWEGHAAIIFPTIINEYSRLYPIPAPFNVVGRSWDLLAHLLSGCSNQKAAKRRIQAAGTVSREEMHEAYRSKAKQIEEMELRAHRAYVEFVRTERDMEEATPSVGALAGAGV